MADYAAPWRQKHAHALLNGAPNPPYEAACARSHVLVVLVVQHVAHEQHDRLFAEILPPVGSRICFGPDFSSLVHDRHCAVAGIFHDLALRDVYERGTVGMTVPRNDAARFDRELAEAKLAILDLRGLLGKIDGAQGGVGDALGANRDRLPRILL